jgi:hypothetical protein
MMNNIITEMKRCGLLRAGNGMLLVDRSTYLVPTPQAQMDVIRAAQAALPDGNLVRAGFDNDSLNSTYRNNVDFVHFKVNGATAIAQGELSTIGTFLSGFF